MYKCHRFGSGFASVLRVVHLDLCISVIVLMVVVASVLRVVQLDLCISAFCTACKIHTHTHIYMLIYLSI